MNGLKQALSRENLAANLKFFVKLNAGLILTAIGIVLFKTPNHFAFGGTSGLSILLAYVLHRLVELPSNMFGKKVAKKIGKIG